MHIYHLYEVFSPLSLKYLSLGYMQTSFNTSTGWGLKGIRVTSYYKLKMATIFDKLGGEPAISLVVDKFYDIMLQDEKTAHFFKNTDMTKQRKSQKNFITMVLGGPNNYEGKDMKTAHAKFKITQQDFDNVWSNLDQAMHFYKVTPELIAQVKGVFYSVVDQVVNSK